MNDQQRPPSPEPTRRSAASGFWGFLRILNVRLRFIVLMVVIGLVVGNWEDIMNHYDRWRRTTRATNVAETQPGETAEQVEYYCGMDPQVIKPEPGNCPICGMPLVPRVKKAKAPLPAGVLGQVQLTPLKMVMGRIGTSPVEYRLLARETRTVGIVDYDETRRATITARFKGRLDKLLVNFTGQKVKEGDPMALIYSPDLLVAQEELLAAVKARGDRKPTTASLMYGDLGQSIVESARRKLMLWGLSAGQVDDIIKRGKVETHVTIFAPMSGIVTEKKALEGKYVAEGEELYTVADLSSVWLQAKVFESDSWGIKPGTAVEVTSTAYPNEVFAGLIEFVAFSVDPATRTIAARVVVANPELKLKPGMYADAAIRLPVGKVEALPAGSPATGPAAASRPASAPAAAPAVATDALAKAYLALAEGFLQDKPTAAAVQALAKEADALAARLPAAGELAAKTRLLEGKDIKAQCEAFQAVSGAAIKLLQQAPPKMALYIAHCPMLKADWITAGQDIRNPYSSQMRNCGSITSALKPSAISEETRFVVGYYCPVYPGQLFDKPAHCPIDKFPLKLARVEKVLAVPEAAIVDTGTRKVAYRETVPGTFDMIEVEVGPRAGEFYPVLSGLKEGDQVATAGAFLVDAENRLNPAIGAQYFGATGSPQAAPAAPAPGGTPQGAGHHH
jgi:membrane fusion protein, copper/silver efflux system